MTATRQQKVSRFPSTRTSLQLMLSLNLNSDTNVTSTPQTAGDLALSRLSFPRVVSEFFDFRGRPRGVANSNKGCFLWRWSKLVKPKDEYL
jgi:hypothetical protein